jgi:hypothetical protein
VGGGCHRAALNQFGHNRGCGPHAYRVWS